MMRKLLSIILLLAVAGTTSAQVPMRIDSKTPQHLMVKKSGIKNTEAMKALRARALAKRAITPTSDQMWFGYGNDAEAENMGLAINADYNLAVYIPYEKLAAKGATVDGLRFMLTSTKAKNIKAWIGTKLPPVGKYYRCACFQCQCRWLYRGAIPTKHQDSRGWSLDWLFVCY